jgi:hypothetical protein
VNGDEILAILRHNAEWDIGGMTLREFSDNKPAILAALNAVMNKPKSRREFRLLDVYAGETGGLLAELGRHIE